MYLAIHSLHSYPYANLNRDDLGSPKTLTFGGASRIRISSQCLKRCIRIFAESKGAMEASVRTREIEALLAERLAINANLPADAIENAAKIVGGAAAGLSGATEKKKTLAFWSEKELQSLTALAEQLTEAAGYKSAEIKSQKKKLKDDVESVLLKAEAGVALFGRMFADTPTLSIDGAVQVAHAFTVHAAVAEQDYFTAVEDWSTSTDSGAGHLDTAEYASGTFYKYANVGLRELTDNLADDTDAARDLIRAFIEGFILATPTGKATSSAPQTYPDFVYLALHEDQPVNLCSAFQEPLLGRSGYQKEAISRLDTTAEAINKFGYPPQASGWASTVVELKEPTALGRNVENIQGILDLAVSTL